MSKYDEKDIFSQSALSPREQVEEWADIRKKVGDKVHGIFKGWWEQKGNPGFRDQIGIAIETKEGKVIGVTVTDTQYMRSKIEETEVGDRVGLRFDSEKDVGKPQKAKIIKFYNPDLQERKRQGVESKGVDPEPVGKQSTDEEDDKEMNFLDDDSDDSDDPFED